MVETDEMRLLAEAIASDVLGSPVLDVIPLVGFGSVNQVFEVRGSAARVIVRLNSEPHRIQEFRKEQWAMERARELGLGTAEVRALGQRTGVSFQVQAFVEGDHPESNDLERWEEIGRAIKKIHSVSVDGWGDQFLEGGATFDSFTPSWEKHVRYNLDQLGPDDSLRLHGLLDERTSEALREAWSAMPAPAIGLCHGDVAMRNVLVRDGEGLVLLDWGCCKADAVPLAEVAIMIAENDPTAPAMGAFFTGYGTSWADLKGPLAPVALLKAVDLCRWALDRRLDELEFCIRRARRALDYYLRGVPWSLPPGRR